MSAGHGAEYDCIVVGAGTAGCVLAARPTCMLLGSFANEARERLSELPGVTGVDVTLDHELEWTEDRFAPHYRQRLTEHRERRRRDLPLLAVTSRSRAGDR